MKSFYSVIRMILAGKNFWSVLILDIIRLTKLQETRKASVIEAREFYEKTWKDYELSKSEVNWEKHNASSIEMTRLNILFIEQNKVLRTLKQDLKQAIEQAIEQARNNV